MNTPIKLMLCLAALSLVALAGCGGGEPADTAAGGPPSPRGMSLHSPRSSPRTQVAPASQETLSRSQLGVQTWSSAKSRVQRASPMHSRSLRQLSKGWKGPPSHREKSSSPAGPGCAPVSALSMAMKSSSISNRARAG